MAQPVPQAARGSRGSRRRSPRTAAPELEPIDLPPAIEQGVDMIYIDDELVPRAVKPNGPLAG